MTYNDIIIVVVVLERLVLFTVILFQYFRPSDRRTDFSPRLHEDNTVHKSCFFLLFLQYYVVQSVYDIITFYYRYILSLSSHSSSYIPLRTHVHTRRHPAGRPPHIISASHYNNILNAFRLCLSLVHLICAGLPALRSVRPRVPNTVVVVARAAVRRTMMYRM